MYDNRGPNDVGLSDGGLSNDGRLYHDGQIYNNRDSNHDDRADNNNESIVDVGSNVDIGLDDDEGSTNGIVPIVNDGGTIVRRYIDGGPIDGGYNREGLNDNNELYDGGLYTNGCSNDNNGLSERGLNNNRKPHND